MKPNNEGENPRNEQQANEGESIFQSMNKDNTTDDENVSSAIKYFRTRRLLAVNSSLLMISHAAEIGRNLNQDDVKAILDMADIFDSSGKIVSEGRLTPELESRFWEASSRISNLVKPASAAAIRERSEFLSASNAKKNSVFASTIGYYKYAVWVTLAITLILHGYYSALSSMITEAKESIKSFDVARTEAFTAIASSKQDQVDSAISISIGNVCATLHNWRSTNEAIATWTFQSKAAESIKAIVDAGDNPSISQNSLCSSNKSNLKFNPNVLEQAEKASPSSNQDSLTPDYIASQLNELRVVDPDTQKALAGGERFRNTIGNFILPLLYGTLGALAYIIRSLTISIREIRYSRAFHFEHGLHIPLGALAGATVGLVVTPETLNTAFGLTVLGLAFGFGYSVDVFFALIDGFISRLTQSQRETTSQVNTTTKS